MEFIAGKTASFKTLGGPIGSEYKGVMIDVSGMTYKMAIMLEPALHTTNDEIYAYINQDPINLRDKKFISFNYNGNNIVMCEEWIIPSSIDITDELLSVTYNVRNIKPADSRVIEDIIRRMGYEVEMII